MVLVDTVYQRVLTLANKEQRGYITPHEFNLFANQAQMDIFEQYFYDLSQFMRRPGNSSEHADMVTILEDNISLFEASAPIVYDGGADLVQVADMYRISTVHFNAQSVPGQPGEHILIERVSEKDLRIMGRGPLTKPTKKRPVYILRGNNIYLSPITPGTFHVSYIRKPAKVEWSSVSVSGNELYDSTNSVDFELHPSEETKLVIKVLSLAGITLKDPALHQGAEQQDNKNIQQEKQ